MGAVIARELADKNLNFIIIEQNDDKIEIIRQKGMYCIHADVTKEETLQAARIKHANGAAVVLDTDQDNLFVTMSIRTYNPDLFLLSRCAAEDNKDKLIRAGANKVVNPYTAGGHRMAEMLTKPQVEDSVSITTPKYENIDLVANELNIGKDAIVFFDDSPLEREEMKNFNPQINVIDVPKDPENFIQSIEKTSFFFKNKQTVEDIKKIISPLLIPPKIEDDADFYNDYGSDTSYHTITGKGECAA